MTSITNLEKSILLKIVKSVFVRYNSNNISKKLNVSRVGTYKAMKSLEKKGLLKSEVIGRAIFYNVDLSDEFVRKNIELLLMEESKQYLKWKEEFKELFDLVDIIILFGSVIQNESNANDIDLLLVFNKENNNKINDIISEKNKILIKKIHPIKQTKKDLIMNINNKDKIILSAIKNGIVLYGFEKILGVIENVSC